MSDILCKKAEGLMVLVMSRGKANAFHAPLMEELYTAVQSAGADPGVRGVVIASGRPGFFSGGFDVREVFHYGREEMSAFFGQFISVCENLRSLPKPVVAALGGHTFAGGAILALACDIRVMAKGPFGFALNEVNLGLSVPPEISRMLMEAVGTARAREMLFSGDPVTPERAYEIGLVHELADPEQVVERAEARARLLASKPPSAFATTKRQLRDLAAGRAAVGSLDGFLDMWFSNEASEARQRLAAKLGR